MALWRTYHVTRHSRFRSRPGASFTGFGRNDIENGPNGATINTPCSFPSDTCSDWIGRPVADSPFGCINYVGTPITVNGEGRIIASPNNVLPIRSDYRLAPSAALNGSLMAVPTGWMLDLVAGTNPSRPVVTPPTLIQDLVELPAMLRNLGRYLIDPETTLRGLPKDTADKFLSVKFGWLPLIEDINHLLDLQKDVIKRSKEIDQLYRGQGLRRRLKFGGDTVVTTTNFQFVSVSLSTATLGVCIKQERKQWATIKWKPTAPPPYHPDDVSLNAYAKRIVLGLTPEGAAKGLWDVIPWTWLLGWFTNIGKYTLAYSNTVPADHGAGCFMNQLKTTITPGTITYSGNWDRRNYSASGGYVYTNSNRTIGTSVTPGVNMPFMDISRLSVLGALFTQRFMR